MNHKFLIDFFNYKRLTVREIREKYRYPIVLPPYELWKNILDAIVNCKATQYVIMPEEYGRRLFEVKGRHLDDYRNRSWLVHWLYAPDVMLNTTTMTVEEAGSFRFKNGIKKAKWDYEIPHRGFGVIDPRTHIEILYPFLYLVEGWKLADLAEKIIICTSVEIDTTGQVPSISEEMMHTVTLRNVSRDLSTLTQLYSDCTCNWGRYGLRRREKRYVGGERIMCRHGIALYYHLQEQGKVESVLPTPTGILNPWWILKERAIIGDRKITRTQMNALLGMLIAYMGVEKAFSLE
ncbi:MAG: hypothetical protein QW350_00070 [Candidatus Aenigmatarchaeota archaeon]